MDFTAGYDPPGVYVSSDVSGSVSALGVSGTIICLVGNGIGHRTYSEAVSFAGGNSQPLSKLGIDKASVVVRGSVLTAGQSVETVYQADGTLRHTA